MKYFQVAAVFAMAFVVNWLAPDVLTHIAKLDSTEAAIASTLWCLGLFLVLGWFCSKVAEGTIFPSFTLQLLVGIVLHDALAPLSLQLMLAVVVCTALAAIILKSGGDEIERRRARIVCVLRQPIVKVLDEVGLEVGLQERAHARGRMAI